MEGSSILVERSPHHQRAAGITLDEQDHLTIVQQGRQGAGDSRLEDAARHNDDDVRVIDRRHAL